MDERQDSWILIAMRQRKYSPRQSNRLNLCDRCKIKLKKRKDGLLVRYCDDCINEINYGFKISDSSVGVRTTWNIVEAGREVRGMLKI